MCFPGERKDPNSSKIDQELLEDQKKRKTHVKLLLLGAGESGKSTIAKQMKIIHLDGFNEEEREGFKSIIYSNIVGSIKTLVEAARTLGLKIEDEETANRVSDDGYFTATAEFTPQVVQDVKRLWADPGIQAAFQRSAEFQLNDSAAYYFNEVDRIGSNGYVPNTQDVLRSRAKTTGIIETQFTVQKTHFTLVDVGGQRSERRKWMHCFQDVTAVIFCAAMSEYDQKLYEDETTNRMHEALKLFKDICNSKWFAETAIILFLNKKDIFEEKIKRVPLKVCFPDYTGPNTPEAAGQYIEDQFLATNENPRKLIYPKRTCATDTDNVTLVFKAVQDIVLNKILEGLGM